MRPLTKPSSDVARTADSRLCFVFNPRSGRNARDGSLLDYTRQFIAQHRLDAKVFLTERAHHAGELARTAVAEGYGLVVAAGGDGTMNEVATALAGTETTLGLLPCGSGNGLGRHLGIPVADERAFDVLLRGRARSIDTGSVNGRPFFNAMGVGFDSEIARRFNQSRRRGLSAYILTTLSVWRTYQPHHYVIDSESGRIETRALLLAVANSDQYGNNCFIAPGAQVDDGRLDLTVLRDVTLLRALPLVMRLFQQRIDGSRHVIRLRSAEFRITRSAAGLLHTDGELYDEPETLKIRVHPRHLRVQVPAENQRPRV